MKICLVVIAAIILFFPNFCPAFEISYSITDIGTLGGDYSAGRAINNAGVVVGDFTSPSLHHAFYYDGEIYDM